jgi:hypothetical protein
MIMEHCSCFEKWVVSERGRVTKQEKRREEEELYAHNMRKLAAPCIEAGGFM